MALTKIRGNTQVLDLSVTNSQIAFPDVDNPDGILLTKIEDGALLVKSDGSVPFTAPVAGVAPVGANDLVTKQYVDDVATGLDVKLSVRAISTTDIALTGTQTVDGVALIAGDRILVAGQADASENGIYVVAAGAWARSADADGAPTSEVTAGLFTFVEEGTANGGTGWVLTTANPIVVGTTDLVFAQFSSSGVIVAGAGLTKTGNVLDVVSANGGIVVNPNNIALTVDPNSTLAITGAGIKLADLGTGQILVGNGANVATAVTPSGDVTVNSAGVFTIAADAVTNNEVVAGSLNLDRLASGTSAQIIVANGAGVPTYVTASGDVTNSNAGVFTIANDAVTTVKILNGAVTEPKLATNSVSTTKIVDAAVTLDKIETLAQANIIVGSATGNVSVVLSGDVTMDEDGVVSINPATVVRVADIITRETPAGTVDGVNQAFTLANTPKAGTEHIYVNGLLMDVGASNDYTISGAVITFTFAPTSGDKIRVSYFK